jgi:hypothetical protein
MVAKVDGQGGLRVFRMATDANGVEDAAYYGGEGFIT